ncbi:MAG: RluA family pseudouridine synthase [Coprobacillus sp.]
MNCQVFYPYLIFTIHSPISIEEFFKQFHLSKKTIHLFKQNKDYTVNNRYVSSSTILLKGDQLKVRAFYPDDNMYPPNYQGIDIIYEDDFILVVNKPPFLNVFPDDHRKDDSLAHRVSGYYHQQGYNLSVRYIHRLDFETSGLVLFSKCAFIQPLLDYQLSQKEISRHYIAIVEGHISDYRNHSIRSAIGHDRHHNQRMRISQNGKPATTHYQLLAGKDNLSVIECQLESGRKHQIRVHMASISYPLLGDKLYNQESHLINRQALHAFRLEFIHPITKEKMTLICHPPVDMQNIIHSIDPKL